MNDFSIQILLSAALKSGHVTRLEAELLLAHVLGVSRSYLRAWPEKTVAEKQQEAFEALVSRCSNGEPIAYLIGHKEFWSLPLVVSNAVLIPRPETECLVELVLKTFNPDLQNICALDLGTGSGAIALALAVERPHWKIIGVDRSLAALEIARHNASSHQITNVEWRESNWFSSFKDEKDKPRFNIIVSNPPYLAPHDSHLESSLRYEPQEALISGPDGLADLKKIISEASEYLASKAWLFLEHAFDQGAVVRETLEVAGFSGVKTYQDLANLSRITVGQRPE